MDGPLPVTPLVEEREGAGAAGKAPQHARLAADGGAVGELLGLPGRGRCGHAQEQDGGDQLVHHLLMGGEVCYCQLIKSPVGKIQLKLNGNGLEKNFVNEHMVDSVSYTHLTLPTNREV